MFPIRQKSSCYTHGSHIHVQADVLVKTKWVIKKKKSEAREILDGFRLDLQAKTQPCLQKRIHTYYYLYGE